MRYVATIHTDQPRFVSRITDLDVAEVGGAKVLISATYVGGGLASFALTDADLPATPRAQWDYPWTFRHQGDPALVLLSDGSDVTLSMVGLSTAARFTQILSSDGALGDLVELYPESRLPADLHLLGEVSIGAQDYIYVVRRGEVEFTIYREEANGRLTQTDRSVMPAADTMPHAALDKIITVQQDGQTVLIAISGQGNFVTSQRLDAQGRIVRGDYLRVQDGTGFNAPNDIAAVTIDGQVYLIVTSSRSSSITTIRILPNGSLITIDHIVDELTTRFQGATALATVEVDGRAYVFVGGVDDGITMFALLPDGRLLHVQTLADDDVMSLSDVSAIAAEEVDGKIVLFVSSATESGITQLAVDPGAAGQVSKVTPPGQVEGTAGNDVLRAGNGTTHLRGGDGDDVLITYRSSIMMWGGAGRDVFVATPVSGRILIWDFDPAEDRLDLTQLGMIRSVWQLKLSPFGKGIRIWFGDTLIEIHSSHGGTLESWLFTNDMFPITHYTPPHVETIIVGSWRNDVLQAARGGSEVYGQQGHDVILGGLVEDLLMGGSGNDTISGGMGNDYVGGGTGHDRLRGGPGDDSLYGGGGNDMLVGDAGDDQLRGNGGNDSIFGGDGTDILFGATGNDYLSGGAGDDVLHGNAGNDSLSGDAGNDRLSDTAGDNILSGGDGDDTLIAGAGADRLTGGAGNDLLHAGAGNDSLDGREGNDRLLAGAGDDRVLAGPGDDVVQGGDGHDLIFGDAGRDTISAGAGRDTVHAGDGDDHVAGDADDDLIHGEDGSDHLAGGAGHDVLHGAAGNDSLHGDEGDDTLIGGDGQNLLSGGEGNDLLQGDRLSDRLEGGGGRDTLFGHAGADLLDGGDGDDLLLGGDGGDDLRGGLGNDLLLGGDGADRLSGQAGDDLLDGGGGQDRIEGGAGADLLWGGDGADHFIFREASDSASGAMDRIADFQTGLDKIDLSALELEFIGTQSFSGAGQLRLVQNGDHQLLRADLDGDGHADLTIRIDGTEAITQDDLLL